MSRPRIELLGGFRLVSEGRSISFSASQKAAVLLAYLACRRGREIPREILIDALWPESDPDSGRTRLRTVLSDLRKLLSDHGIPETEVLAASRGGVALDAALVSTDLADFQGYVKPGPECGQDRIQKLESGLSLYQGDLLPGFYDEWAQSLRDDVSKRRAEAINELAVLHESEGNPDRAVAWLRTLVRDDPLNEDIHCEIMRLHLAAGSPSAALKQFAEVTRILQVELDVEPGERACSLAAEARSKAKTTNGKRAETERQIDEPITGLPTVAVKSPTQVAGFAPRYLRQGVRVLAVVLVCGPLIAGVANSQYRKKRPAPQYAASAKPQLISVRNPRWTYRFEPQEGDRGSDARAVCADAQGNAYIAGFADNEKTDNDFFVVKVDKEGNEVWPKPFRYDGPGHDVDRIYSMALDAQGNIYVTGDSDNGTGDESWTRLSGTDFCTIKLGPDGEPSPTWNDVGHGAGVRRYNGPDNGEEKPKELMLDGAGNVYVMGWSFSRKGGKDFAVVKYDQDGKEAWSARFDGSARGEDEPNDIALDPDGGVYVTGFSRAGSTDAPETNMLTVRFAAGSGRRQWVNVWGASNQSDDNGRGLVADASESIVVVGDGRTGTGTFNHKRPGLVLLTIDKQRGTITSARGSRTDSDHLDSVRAGHGGSHHLGLYEGHVKYITRDPGGRSELVWQSKAILTDYFTMMGAVQGIYIVGTIPVESPGDSHPSLSVFARGPGGDWMYPGPGGLNHSSRAATIWLQPGGNKRVRQWVLVAGQFDTGPRQDLFAFGFDADSSDIPPGLRSMFRN